MSSGKMAAFCPGGRWVKWVWHTKSYQIYITLSYFFITTNETTDRFKYRHLDNVTYFPGGDELNKRV